MKLVCAALHHLVELAARRVAEVRAELILQEGEFGNGIVGNEHQWARDAAAVVVDAFDGEVIIARALAPDAGTGAYADARRWLRPRAPAAPS